jgi:exoribonuclease-2
MLPERLSTHLTSLKPDQERLAMVVEMSIDSTGNMLDYDLYPATVKSRAKLVYQQVADWLNHSVVPHPIYEDPLLQEQLRWHLEVTCLLQKYRESQGTLTLTSIEPYIRMNGQVQVTSMVNNCAYELIQNLMIAANTATALFMQKHHIPCLRRVIRTPKRWPRIVEIARHYGTHLPDEPSVQALESFLLEQKNKDSLRFPDLSLTIIKLLGRGEYIIENPEDPPQGHFNLGLQRYTHATAPNRRFSDLIIQRCLATLFDNVTLPYTQQELTLLAQRCTTKEVDAEKVERKIKKSAMIIALSPRIGDTFEAIVTGSSPKGTWVRLFNPPVEGKLVQGFQHVDVGDRLRVQLIHVDLDQGFIDFSTI